MSRTATHPEVHVHEPFVTPDYSTCHQCHRTFHARTGDQPSVRLCDECLEAAQNMGEKIPCVHVKPRPYRPAGK